MNQTKGKIIWAVNPTKNPTEAKALVKEMKIWANKLNCDIQPVAVFSKLNIGFPSQLNVSWGETFEELAHATFKNYLKKLSPSDFLTPEMIFTNSLSNRKMASELAEYAKKNHATLIFANTRVKKTLNPIRLGGFAESLISISYIPVILMNPAVESRAQKKAVLFPTDLSVEDHQVLNKITPWISALQSKLVLYNQLELLYMYANDFGSQVPIDQITKEAINSRKESLQKLQKSLDASHIKSEAIVAKGHKYLGAQIIEVAKKNKVELILVINHSGPMYQAILGSVARDILVQAKCPVLVIHQDSSEKAKFETIKTKKNVDQNRALEKSVSHP